MGNKKIISYSIYGGNERYTGPLLTNASNYKSFYPDWVMRIYYDSSVPEEIVKKFKKFNVESVKIEQTENINPKAWRFLPVLDDNVDAVIFRDADSVLTKREVELVNEWLLSDKTVHIIRDHPLHVSPVLSGMSGIKKAEFESLKVLLPSFHKVTGRSEYDHEQVLLCDKFYPSVIKNALVHSSFLTFFGENAKQIRPVDDGINFIGSIVYASSEDIEMNKQLIQNSEFIVGIPYFMAKLFRYKVRVIFYTSLIFNRFYKIFKF